MTTTTAPPSAAPASASKAPRFKWFNYRIEVDFAGNAVNLTDAYLQYTKIPKTLITLGQHKAPFGLESNNSDNYNTFLERGMFTNAFGNAGAERRIGLSVGLCAQGNAQPRRRPVRRQ